MVRATAEAALARLQELRRHGCVDARELQAQGVVGGRAFRSPAGAIAFAQRLHVSGPSERAVAGLRGASSGSLGRARFWGGLRFGEV
eukprot:13859442-Alexandrium_andersonii.AAC.1